MVVVHIQKSLGAQAGTPVLLGVVIPELAQTDPPCSRDPRGGLACAAEEQRVDVSATLRLQAVPEPPFASQAGVNSNARW